VERKRDSPFPLNDRAGMVRKVIVGGEVNEMKTGAQEKNSFLESNRKGERG